MTAEKLRALIALTASPVEGEARNAALAACKALRECPGFLGAPQTNDDAPLRAEIARLKYQIAQSDEARLRLLAEYNRLSIEAERLQARLASQQSAAPKAAPTRFARFPSRFRGRCQGCDGKISVGEPIAYAKDHGAYHEGCCPL